MAFDLTMGGQFALIPAKVLYDEQLPATAKLLYGEIYRLSHANGYCYASNQDFTKLLDRSPSTVGDLLKALADGGYIRVKMIRRYGASGDIVQRRIFCGQTLAPETEEDDSGGIPENRDTSPEKPVDRLPKNRDTTTKRINKKEKKEKKISASPEEVLAEFAVYAGTDAGLMAAINGFLEKRAKKGNPLDTLRSVHILTNKLDRLSGGDRTIKILLLDNATEHGWASVFPLKPDELPPTQAGRMEEQEGVTYF